MRKRMMQKNCNGLQHCYRQSQWSEHCSTQLRFEWHLSVHKLFLNMWAESYGAEVSVIQVSTKPPATLPFKKVCSPHTCFCMHSWESLKSELWAGSSVAAINCLSTNHLAWARCEHWNVFYKPSLCWHPDAAWLAPGQRSLLLSICSRGILSWYFELRKGGVKTWNSTTWSSNRRRHVLL